LELAVDNSEGKWEAVTGTAYLQKGINIVDVDADVDLALDYLKVDALNKTEEVNAYTTVIEAEDCIPEEAVNDIQIGESAGASAGKYVKEMDGDENAKETVGKYLDIIYDAPKAGVYQMQVFQSNDEICGHHVYNTKVIYKYMSFSVRNEAGEETSDARYFFMNTNSQDSFIEKTIPVQLSEGKNTIRVYNDDSWHVYYGGSQSEPGTDKLDNRTPNIDKFIITPSKLDSPVVQEVRHGIDVRTTAGGYAVASENTVEDKGTFHVTIAPDTQLLKVLVDGTDCTDKAKENEDGTYTLSIENVTSDKLVKVYFADVNSEYLDTYIKNAGFGTGKTNEWTAENVSVKKDATNGYEGYYASLGKDGNLSQIVKDVPAGKYYLGVFSKGKDEASGKVTLSAKINDTVSKKTLNIGDGYRASTLMLEVAEGDEITISVDTEKLTGGTICVDNFSLVPVPERDTAKVSKDIEYFVNCGDHNPNTLPDGELFGKNNSVTEQAYAIDEVTGYNWGIVTTDEDPEVPRPIFKGGSAVWTKYTQPYYWNTDDKPDKDDSLRETTGQDNMETKYIRYAFELDPGTYEIYMGMQCDWSTGDRVILANGKQLGDIVKKPETGSHYAVIRNVEISEKDENQLYLSVESSKKIMLNYIKISKISDDTTYSTRELKKLYDEVKDLLSEDYTSDSWKTFADALSAAKEFTEVDSVPIEQKEEVVNALTNLQKAYDGLVRIFDPYKQTAASDYTGANKTNVHFDGVNNDDADGDGKGDGYANVGWIAPNDWLKFGTFNFGDKSPTTFRARIAGADAQRLKLEVRLDRQDGPVIATIDTDYTGGWQTYKTAECELEVKDITGMHDVYVVFGTGLNMNWIQFTSNPPVEDKELEGLSITPPTKTEYEIGEELDLEGLAVTANYSDGSQQELAAGSYTVEGFDSETPGQKTVTVSYTEGDVTKTAEFTVTVKEKEDPDKTLTGITVTPPEKTQYEIGEPFDSTGLKVMAQYSDSTEAEVTDYTVSEVDTCKAGEQKVTVTYKEQTAEFTILVKERVLTGIEVIVPDKTDYLVGEDFDPAGMVVNAVYSNKVKEEVSSEDYTVEGFDSAEAGEKVITVTYKEMTAEFAVNVKEETPEPVLSKVVLTPPEKTEYVVGETLDLTGLAVYAHYSDGSYTELTPEEYQITELDTTVPGIQYVTITYGEMTAEFMAVVTEAPKPEVTKIEVKAPDKVTYQVGETLDTEGMMVTAYYADGSQEEVTNYTVSELDSSTPGEKTITVTYGEATADFKVTVEEPAKVPHWEKDRNGWWYNNGDGTWPKNTWKQIDGSWYYFDKYGYRAEGWVLDGKTWYYCDEDGVMQTGWLQLGSTWYYLKSSGAMATGWLQEGNTWYYLKNSGAMATGWAKVGSTWYYLKGNGAMATGWLQEGSTWYYLKSSGAMATGWVLDGNTWYYLKNSGAMVTGWAKVGNTWYYMKSNGAMATGWVKVGNTWYYLRSSGAMASSTWIGKYYVNGSGAWTKTR
jgi:glucan-binding YG repeat protein